MLFIFGFSYVPIQGMTSSECSTTGIAAAATGVSHAARASFTLSSFCIAERIPRSAQRSERNQSNADLLPTGTIKHHERSSLIDSKLRGVEWVFGKFTQSHYL